jgi:predicted nucleotidyltransferase
MTDPLLDRETLQTAFARLAEELKRRRVRADVYVFGGAAMILAYGVDRATRDVDAVFEPHGAVIEAARDVATRHGLPSWWLNNQAAVYLSPLRDSGAAPVFDHPHLRVAAASGEHLVAMKALAARAQDLEDLRHLAARLGMSSAEEVFAIVTRVFPEEQLPDRKRLLVEDLFA